MNTMKTLSFISTFAIIASIPAVAAVTVNSPANTATVSSPFTLSAISTVCSSQAVTAMGFSFDASSSTTTVNGTVINTSVSAGNGAHTIHVKSWGNQGASCVTDVAVNVQTVAVSALSIPSTATTVSSLQTFSGWSSTNDSAAGGQSSGSTGVVSSPSRTGSARRFTTAFSGNGAQRYKLSFGDDETAANFLYDGWIYLTSSASSVANIEMDMNQTMANGQTVIFGFQCDGWNGTWDYTKNAGTPARPKDAWVHTGAACNPRKWAINTWHHVQISYSRNDAGVVTYNAVWLDDAMQSINATVPSAFALGWGPTLLTNFQIDGLGSGANTVYLDALTIYRW